MFDALLSGKRRAGELKDEDFEVLPMSKTKQITKNYNTRLLFKTVQKPKVKLMFNFHRRMISLRLKGSAI